MRIRHVAHARHTPEEYADTFGGIAAKQDAIAAIESDDPAAAAEAFIRGCFPASVRLEIAKEAQK